MSRQERLKKWIDTLTAEQIKSIALECIDNLIDFEYIKFYDHTKIPYWEGNGENLDGSEDGEDEIVLVIDEVDGV